MVVEKRKEVTKVRKLVILACVAAGMAIIGITASSAIGAGLLRQQPNGPEACDAVGGTPVKDTEIYQSSDPSLCG